MLLIWIPESQDFFGRRFLYHPCVHINILGNQMEQMEEFITSMKP